MSFTDRESVSDRMKPPQKQGGKNHEKQSFILDPDRADAAGAARGSAARAAGRLRGHEPAGKRIGAVRIRPEPGGARGLYRRQRRVFHDGTAGRRILFQCVHDQSGRGGGTAVLCAGSGREQLCESAGVLGLRPDVPDRGKEGSPERPGRNAPYIGQPGHILFPVF